MLYLAALAAVTVLPVVIFNRAYDLFADLIVNTITEDMQYRSAALTVFREFLRNLVPSIRTVDYSAYFVLMGVIWYFVKNKYACAGILVLFSAFSCFGTYGVNIWALHDLSDNIVRIYYPLDFFGQVQFYMVFAAVFILLYNGQRGRGVKWFFYGYYPVHVFVISAANSLIYN